MSCNNGKTYVVSLTTIPGGTAANASYLLALDHYLCGNRKLCTQESFPVTADLKFTPMGTPVNVGNGSYCCEVLVSGNITYLPYTGNNCNCGVCPRTEGIYSSICIPCSSAAVPTITAGESVAVPTGALPCCNITNAVAITTSLNVTTA